MGTEPTKPNEKEEETTTPTAEELQVQLGAEREKNTQLTSRLDRLEAALIQSGVRGRDGADEPDSEEEPEEVRRPRRAAREPDEEEPDFENMSTKDMARWVLGKIGKQLGEFEKSVDTKINRVRTESQAKALVDEVVEVMQDYPDVVEYQQQIVRLMADNPKLGVEDAYFLALRRAGKPMPSPKASTASKPEETTAEEGGLQPRGSARPVKKESAPQTFEEAGHRAWKKLGVNL